MAYGHLYPVHLACFIHDSLVSVDEGHGLESFQFVSDFFYEGSDLVVHDFRIAFSLDFLLCCLKLLVEELAYFIEVLFTQHIQK